MSRSDYNKEKVIAVYDSKEFEGLLAQLIELTPVERRVLIRELLGLSTEDLSECMTALNCMTAYVLLEYASDPVGSMEMFIESLMEKVENDMLLRGKEH